MSNLQENGKLPASSDSSPQALPIPRSRPHAQRSANPRNKGRHPASSDTSPGALPIPKPRAKRSADSLRRPKALPPALPPAPEPIHFDEEECKEDEEAAGAGAETEGNIYGSNNHIAKNIPAASEARLHAVEGREDIREPEYQPPSATEEPKQSHERRLFLVLLAMTCLLALLLVVGVVALVMYLPKPAGVAPPATSTPTTIGSSPTPNPSIGSSPVPETTTAPPTSEAALRIACNFLSIPDLTECRSTVKFDSYDNDGNETTGSTIPTEIALMPQLTWLSFFNNSLTGTIPTEMGLMHQLTALAFGNNQLTGTIPSEIGLMDQLTALAFINNTLTGTIPSEMGLLTQLTLLAFAGNDLSGTMPSSLCSLSPTSIAIYIYCGEIECASGCCWSVEYAAYCG